MINFYFSDGTKQVLNPSPSFFVPPVNKREPSVLQKCADIASDLKATHFEILK